MILSSYEEYDDGEDSSYAWDDFKVNTETELEEIYIPNDSSIWNKIPTDKLVSGNLDLQKNMIIN